MIRIHSLEVSVADNLQESIPNSKVTLSADELEFTPQFNLVRQVFVFDNVPPGFYQLKVEADGFQKLNREIQVHPRTTIESVILASTDIYTWRGKNQLDFKKHDRHFAAYSAIDRSFSRQTPDWTDLEHFLNQNELEISAYLTDDPESDWVNGDPIAGEFAGNALVGFVIKFNNADQLTLGSAVTVARESQLFSTVGPLLSWQDQEVVFFTGRIWVHFRSESSKEDVDRVIREFMLKDVIHQNHGGLNSIFVEPNNSSDYRINDTVIQLEENEEAVDSAEPEFATRPKPTSLSNSEYLSAGQWEHKPTNIPEAWKVLGSDCRTSKNCLGDPNLITGFLDFIPTVRNRVTDPELNGGVSDGREKVYAIYDFIKQEYFQNQQNSFHGTICASVAIGNNHAHVLGKGKGFGISGVAPNVRFAMGTPRIEEYQNLNALRWLAGNELEVEPDVEPDKMPKQLDPGCDLISCSWKLHIKFPLLDAAKNCVKQIAQRGRNGKGCPIFISAANDGDDDIEKAQPLGTSGYCFTCAASTIDKDGKESRAEYSCVSGDHLMEFCVPSSTKRGKENKHLPPERLGIWSAITQHKGNLPSIPVLETICTITSENSITVENTEGLFENSILLVGDLDGIHEVVKVASGFSPNDFDINITPEFRHYSELKPRKKIPLVSGARLLDTNPKPIAAGSSRVELSNTESLSLIESLMTVLGALPITIGLPSECLGDRQLHFVTNSVLERGILSLDIVPNIKNEIPAGSQIAITYNGHRNNSGGTSTATPFCAGIAALVLTANPKLTWVEVRQILRDSAKKIDPDTTHSLKRWVDEYGIPTAGTSNDPYVSPAYGFGRLNAKQAVENAFGYDKLRDLMIRNHLKDDGTKPTKSEANSPDIWVRRLPKSEDRGSEPASDINAGPHQSPLRSNDCWIYVRVHNRGVEPSLDASARIYVASYQGVDFQFPDDFRSDNGKLNLTDDEWESGTFFIGEIHLPAIKPKSSQTFHHPWKSNLFPPDSNTDGNPWNARILVEITPLDGPLEGKTVDDNNNLAEKAIEFAIS